MKTQIIATALLAAATLPAGAKVAAGSLITDNMVLAQNTNARIYGKADPGARITVTPSWNGKTYATSADRVGEWSVGVETPAGGYTPYTITISDGEPVTISNVLIGEVWLASGQSNMEMPLKGFPGCVVDGGYDEMAAARHQADNIRFFTVPRIQSYTPLDSTDAVWTVPSADTAPEYSATAWYFARQLNDVLDVPIGIVSAAYGGAKVESWTPREILETYPDVSLDPKDIEATVHYLRPMLMWNALFNPIKNYTYDGIIWYQGCSNVGADATYADRLATMVRNWREEIGLGDIPFYQVEIAPYDYDGDQDEKAPLLRRAQWEAAGMIPNSGIICINDLVAPYERHNIHPGNKKGVGHRLANLALNKNYGKKQFLCEHPRYRSHEVKGPEVWVAIDSPSDGVCRNYDIRGFEVAGKDGVFHTADKVWLHWQTNELVVSSKDVPEPVSVRYCWQDFLPGTMHAADHLPLVPFCAE